MAAKKGAPRRAYKFPSTVGACLARLAGIRMDMAPPEAEVARLAEEEAALREHMLASFKKAQLEGARGAGLVASIRRSTLPTLKDWKSFLRFATRPGNDDLLQRAVNIPAWRERNDARKAVPGVVPFNRVSLSVTKDARAKK